MTSDSANILVVEDESGMRDTLSANLEDQGHRVVTSKSGKEAVGYIRRSPPDVVIADLRLPDASVLEILETLKDIKPEAAFIIITGYASMETAVQALNEGAFAYIAKPFDMDQLHSIVRNALRQQRLLLENQRLVERLQRSNAELSTEVAERQRAEEALERQAEELKRSNAELEQFAYVASHDLREPLRMVTNYTQLLQKRYGAKLGGDADQFIAYAVDGASRMQQLIDDLLDYSRVGTLGKDLQTIDCEVVLERVLVNLQTTVEESGVVVTYGPLPTVMGDTLQLEQVFQNLISNAIKFRGERRPEVHIGAERQNGQWRFSVRDNGIGIDPKHQQRIFGLFQRLHTREEYPGTGIGLAICQKIVERHAGRIWVESEVGRGATFYFTLPGTGDNPA